MPDICPQCHSGEMDYFSYEETNEYDEVEIVEGWRCDFCDYEEIL